MRERMKLWIEVLWPAALGLAAFAAGFLVGASAALDVKKKQGVEFTVKYKGEDASFTVKPPLGTDAPAFTIGDGSGKSNLVEIWVK